MFEAVATMSSTKVVRFPSTEQRHQPEQPNSAPRNARVHFATPLSPSPPSPVLASGRAEWCSPSKFDFYRDDGVCRLPPICAPTLSVNTEGARRALSVEASVKANPEQKLNTPPRPSAAVSAVSGRPRPSPRASEGSKHGGVPFTLPCKKPAVAKGVFHFRARHFRERRLFEAGGDAGFGPHYVAACAAAAKVDSPREPRRAASKGLCRAGLDQSLLQGFVHLMAVLLLCSRLLTLPFTPRFRSRTLNAVHPEPDTCPDGKGELLLHPEPEGKGNLLPGNLATPLGLPIPHCETTAESDFW